MFTSWGPNILPVLLARSTTGGCTHFWTILYGNVDSVCAVYLLPISKAKLFLSIHTEITLFIYSFLSSLYMVCSHILVCSTWNRGTVPMMDTHLWLHWNNDSPLCRLSDHILSAFPSPLPSVLQHHSQWHCAATTPVLRFIRTERKTLPWGMHISIHASKLLMLSLSWFEQHGVYSTVILERSIELLFQDINVCMRPL